MEFEPAFASRDRRLEQPPEHLFHPAEHLPENGANRLPENRIDPPRSAAFGTLLCSARFRFTKRAV